LTLPVLVKMLNTVNLILQGITILLIFKINLSINTITYLIFNQQHIKIRLDAQVLCKQLKLMEKVKQYVQHQQIHKFLY
jgi:hypothetical protein